VSYRAYQRAPNGALRAFVGFKQMCEHRVSRVVEFNLSDTYPCAVEARLASHDGTLKDPLTHG
jgi:hypothetical protein